jgi:hypothetical protein
MAVTPPTQMPMPANLQNPYAPPTSTPTVASPNSTNTSIAPKPKPIANPIVQRKINQYSEYL